VWDREFKSRSLQRRVAEGILLTFHIPSIGFPYYAGRLSDFWSDHPQANRLGSLLTIGHVNSDALGLC
jgi:hypothetical protein